MISHMEPFPPSPPPPPTTFLSPSCTSHGFLNHEEEEQERAQDPEEEEGEGEGEGEAQPLHPSSPAPPSPTVAAHASPDCHASTSSLPEEASPAPTPIKTLDNDSELCISRPSEIPDRSVATETRAKRSRYSEKIDVKEQTDIRQKRQCKAQNVKCPSEMGKSTLIVTFVRCDICCTEPRFCPECSCILCGKTIDTDDHDYNLIRCVAKLSAAGVCGHAVHLQCALACQMAGISKQTGLGMGGYLCRRCDRKTDLKGHVVALVKSLAHTKVRRVAERNLKLALQIMEGAETDGKRSDALQALQTGIQMVQRGSKIQEAYAFLQSEISPPFSGATAVSDGYKLHIDTSELPPVPESQTVREMQIQASTSKETEPSLDKVSRATWEKRALANRTMNRKASTVEVLSSAVPPQSVNSEAGAYDGRKVTSVAGTFELSGAPNVCSSQEVLVGRSLDGTRLTPFLNLLADGFENEIHQTLEKLEAAQKAEYALAQKKLTSQRQALLHLYVQLDEAKVELARTPAASSHTLKVLTDRISGILECLQKESINFKNMLNVSKGFGLTQKFILQELFGLSVDPTES